MSVHDLEEARERAETAAEHLTTGFALTILGARDRATAAARECRRWSGDEARAAARHAEKALPLEPRP